MASSVNMVDELESSLQNCIGLITNQDQSNVSTDSDELRTSMEQCIHRFLDASRQLDCFFVQKRLLLTKFRPETSSGREDLAELKAELQRKEALIQRHNEKLQHWQAALSGRSSAPAGSSPLAAATSAAPASLGVPPQSVQPPAPPPMSSPIGAPGFSGPLAYLEQTTSSIGSAVTPR